MMTCQEIAASKQKGMWMGGNPGALVCKPVNALKKRRMTDGRLSIDGVSLALRVVDRIAQSYFRAQIARDK